MAGQDGADYGELSADLAATWLNSFVLARRAGLRASFPRESSDWSRLPMLLLPSPLTSSKRNLLHVHTTFWQRAKDYVRGGGALYVSLNGESAIPEMEELFGARLADRIPAHDLRIKVVAPFGDLKPGDEFAFASGGATGDWGALLEPRDGQVIATDQSGHPALIAHTLGKGKVLTCAYPIEKYLSRVPAAFDDGDSTHRVYRALAEWAGVEPLFRSDRAEVEAAALTGPGRGYVVLTNHSDAAQSVTVTALKALRSVQLVQPEGDSPLELHGKVFAIRMAPFGGEIVEYRELPQ